jgi:hypothetical protein
MLSKTRVESIAEHIRNCVQAVNTHDTAAHDRLYVEGFILGHLASIFAHDPILYRMFLEHCESLAKTRGSQVDMQRK